MMDDGRIYRPRSTFSSVAGLLSATLAADTRWELLLSDGTVWCSGTTDSSGALRPAPWEFLRNGGRFPVSEYALGTNAAGQLEVINVDSGTVTMTASGLQIDGTPGDEIVVRFPGLVYPARLEVELEITETVTDVNVIGFEMVRSKDADFGGEDTSGCRLQSTALGAWSIYGQKHVDGSASTGTAAALTGGIADIVLECDFFPRPAATPPHYRVEPRVQDADDRTSSVNATQYATDITGQDITDPTDTWYFQVRLRPITTAETSVLIKGYRLSE